MNMLARIAATGFVAAFAMPASALTTTTYTVALTPPITFGALVGTQVPTTIAYVPVTGRTIIIPKLALATRQTITKVTIELLTTLTSDPTNNNRIVNGTGAVKNYTIVNSSATTLSGPLPTGSALSLIGNNTVSTTATGIVGRATALLSWSSPQVTSTQIYSTGNLNPFDAFGASTSFLLNLGATGSNTTTQNGSGNFDRYIKSLITTTVRVSYESREWIPGDPPVPEPATWMTMIAGFGIVGAAMRRRRIGGFAAR